MPLEVVRAALLLAPAEVEHPVSFLRAPPHQLPVHEVVDGVLEGILARPAVVGHDDVPIVEDHDARLDPPLAPDQENPAGLAQLLPDDLEPAERKDRRPQVADALCVNLVKGLHGVVLERRREAVLVSLADHPPLFPGDRREVRLGIGVDRPAERDVEVLRGKRVPVGVDVPEFRIVDAEPSRQVARGGDERLLGFGIRRKDSPVNAERDRHEGVPEETALHLEEREDAPDLAGLHRRKVVRPVAERPLDDPPPDCLVEDRPVRMAGREDIPRPVDLVDLDCSQHL